MNKNIDGLYHRGIGLPVGLAGYWEGCFELRYSQHAKQAACNDRYGAIALPGQLAVPASAVVEIQVQDGVAVKAVVRVQLDARRDLVLVLNRPSLGVCFVRTVWVNEHNDKHRSLDRSKYRQP